MADENKLEAAAPDLADSVFELIDMIYAFNITTAQRPVTYESALIRAHLALEKSGTTYHRRLMEHWSE
jgi:hypothetical protein